MSADSLFRCLVFVVITAALLIGTYYWRHRQSEFAFSEAFTPTAFPTTDPSRDVLNDAGDVLHNTSCKVASKGGGMYVFSGLPHLEAHKEANKCVLRRITKEPHVMDDSLSLCSAANSYLRTTSTSVVTDVRAEVVDADERCVVTLKPDLEPDEYAKYEVDLRDAMTVRSVIYRDLVSKYKQLQIDLAAVRAEISALEKEIKILNDAYEQLHAEYLAVLDNIRRLTAELEGINNYIRELNDRIAHRTKIADGLASELADWIKKNDSFETGQVKPAQAKHLEAVRARAAVDSKYKDAVNARDRARGHMEAIRDNDYNANMKILQDLMAQLKKAGIQFDCRAC